MTTTDDGSPQWTVVDEGWGRKAVDFATLSEPGNWREYVTVHHRLGVDAGEPSSVVVMAAPSIAWPLLC